MLCLYTLSSVCLLVPEMNYRKLWPWLGSLFLAMALGLDAGTLLCTVSSMKQMVKSTSLLGNPSCQCQKRGRYKYGIRGSKERPCEAEFEWENISVNKLFLLNLLPSSVYRKALDSRTHISREHTWHPDIDF